LIGGRAVEDFASGERRFELCIDGADHVEDVGGGDNMLEESGLQGGGGGKIRLLRVIRKRDEACTGI
jgi:hypothetical protein